MPLLKHASQCIGLHRPDFPPPHPARPPRATATRLARCCRSNQSASARLSAHSSRWKRRPSSEIHSRRASASSRCQGWTGRPGGGSAAPPPLPRMGFRGVLRPPGCWTYCSAQRRSRSRSAVSTRVSVRSHCLAGWWGERRCWVRGQGTGV